MAALRNQVQPAIGILLGDGDNLSRASDIGDAFLQSTDYAERGFVGHALADHLFVAWFEYVQGQGCARKQNYIERKQRKERQTFSSQRGNCTLIVRQHRQLP